MKTRSIIAFLILCAAGVSRVSAQETQPGVVREGRIWNFYEGRGGGGLEWMTGRNFGMFFGADTVIDGKTYKNVLYRRVFHWDNFDELPAYDWGCALREEGPRVYHYDYGRKEERLMLDFSLQPGDTVETYSRFVVTSVGFTEGAMPLRYIKLRQEGIPEDREELCGDRWIERVGSREKGIFWEDCWCCVGGVRKLACCKEMDEENPFFTISHCLSAEYTTLKGKIAFVSLSGTDSSTVWAVIDNPYEEPDGYAPKYTTLMRNSTPFAQRLTVDGVEYLAGDEVEITGWLSSDWRYSDLEIQSIRRTNLSVQPSQEAGLKLTPNPARETITLSASGCSLQRVEILDANGRVLYAATLNNTDSFRYNVSWMPSGIYLARVKTPCGVLTEKFSVK